MAFNFRRAGRDGGHAGDRAASDGRGSPGRQRTVDSTATLHKLVDTDRWKPAIKRFPWLAQCVNGSSAKSNLTNRWTRRRVR